MKARILIAVTAAVSAAAVLLLGGALRTSQGAAGAAPAVRPALQPVHGTEADVRKQQALVRADPTDVRALTALGFAYEQRMRETDRARHAYVRHFHRADARDPALYHLLINSTVIELAGCVEIIALAAEGRTRQAALEAR